MNWVLAILAIGALIVVHETGHYVVARLCSMRVEKFSIGFGPAILKWKSPKTGTQFQLAPIPFGGFVEIKGMNIIEEVDPNDASAYPNRPAWQRFVTIFAGPATNYLFAVILAFGLFTFAGIQSDAPPTEVDQTDAGYSAAGKLLPGDRFVGVEGAPLSGALGPAVTAIGDRDAVFQIRRVVDGKSTVVDVTLHPKYDKEHDSWRLGVQLRAPGRASVGVGTAAKDAIVYPVVQTKVILTGLYLWITGKAEGRMSSVVGIGQVVKQAIDESWVVALELLMVLNVYLGLFNLFPLPALDGGRLVFLGYEMVTRRRANPKLEATIHMVGVLVLFVLIVVVTVNDCRHL